MLSNIKYPYGLNYKITVPLSISYQQLFEKANSIYEGLATNIYYHDGVDAFHVKNNESMSTMMARFREKSPKGKIQGSIIVELKINEDKEGISSLNQKPQILQCIECGYQCDSKDSLQGKCNKCNAKMIEVII